MFTSLPLPVVLAIFAACGVVILLLGVRMTALADRIADLTGLGEAVVGAVLLGAATSLSGVVVSVTAALDGRASLAFANGIGGIAAQTVFLAVADMIHRRANLEHAAAEVTNLFQAALLMVLLALPLVAWSAPEVSFWSVHPVSLLMLAGYIAGVVATRRARQTPMWRPVRTKETRPDDPDEEVARSGAARVIGVFVFLMVLMGIAGWLVAQSAVAIVTRVGISETIVGALMTAVVTSLPELVTTLAAVRRGAMQLALGGIIGGNTFDTLFLAASDAAYRDGSIYHAVARTDFLWLTVGMLMTGVLLMGLILRERDGPFRIGTESVLLLAIYGGAVAIQLATG
ncbi:Sodium/calcium exchanger membrane region protein [Oceanicola granulosus HTCC2516]|uniref:Sodium/calcium exchanger membrane region protein n=1 Tax=Oceanicola granulosus (strain ATCC BAA-861 / DSM 15982 / KCTC 12143 / HTCC2516) TaxID=314256 RepID=Q2CHR3_OCEGH|nr:sodium:calcium antiporter [Oceanicola granulosus]EAR52231.1 Sodium/calcium exchanger membrane region protein [Oceanicola granulosus HTCC2516]